MFLGWSTTSCSGSKKYVPEATYNTEAGTTLYALWGQCSTTNYQYCQPATLCYANGMTTVYSGAGGTQWSGTLRVDPKNYPSNYAKSVYLVSGGTSGWGTVVMVLQNYCLGLSSKYIDTVGRGTCVSSDMASNGFQVVNTYSEPAYIGYMANVCIANNGLCGSCNAGSSYDKNEGGRSCYHCTVQPGSYAAWYQWGYSNPSGGTLKCNVADQANCKLLANN